MGRFFYDAEFLEDGAGSPLYLLSLAIVTEDDRELYLVDRDCPIDRANLFVRQNVLPKIDWTRAVSRNEMRRRVLEFVGEDVPEFWSSCAAYDWVVLCGLIGRMADLPKHWPHYTCDLKFWSQLLGKPRWPDPDPEHEHDALYDARWHRDVWKFLGKGSVR